MADLPDRAMSHYATPLAYCVCISNIAYLLGMELDMSVITPSANFAQAMRKVKDREISYRWYSPSQSIQFEGELVGGVVSLNISHDADRKRFTAFIQFAHYDRSRGYESVQFTVFDTVNYPHGMVASQPIARYSVKALDQFEAQVIELLTTNTALIANDAVREAWNRATLIAMGGDGTHGA